jgi:hypothetical protein
MFVLCMSTPRSPHFYYSNNIIVYRRETVNRTLMCIWDKTGVRTNLHQSELFMRGRLIAYTVKKYHSINILSECDASGIYQ